MLEERLKFNQDSLLTNCTLNSALVTSKITLGDHNTFSYKMTVRVPLHDTLFATVKGALKSGDSVARTKGELKNSTFLGETST